MHIHVCLYSKNGAVYSKWEALSNFLLQLQAHDYTIQLLPWKVTNHNGDNLAIKISSIPHAFFDLHMYVPQLASLTASWTTRAELGCIWHSYLFFSSLDSPAHLVNKMGPWLHTTKQGMWPCHLPLAEETICLGWLLYSALEYDLPALSQQIKMDTGGDMVLHFHTILDGLPVHVTHNKPHIKAIHLEVKQGIPSQLLKCIEQIYSSTARTFPLGIKMWLVPELQAMTTPEAHDKVINLQELQAWFLASTEIYRIGGVVDTIPNKNQLYDTLHAMTMPLSQGTKPTNCCSMLSAPPPQMMHIW